MNTKTVVFTMFIALKVNLCASSDHSSDTSFEEEHFDIFNLNKLLAFENYYRQIIKLKAFYAISDLQSLEIKSRKQATLSDSLNQRLRTRQNNIKNMEYLSRRTIEIQNDTESQDALETFASIASAITRKK